MSVKTYDPGSLAITIAGIPISGFGDGTFLTVTIPPAFTKGSGSDGEGWRAKSNDKTAEMALTLLQTSASNDALSALATLDELSGDGVDPFLAKDNSGRTVVFAETVWLEKKSDLEFAREVTNREWPIHTDSLNVLVGGN